MAPQPIDEATYRVEVSGWDVGENFFVEKTTLAWGENGDKKILLRTLLHEGSLVFVRLANELNCSRGISVTYQVGKIGNRSSECGREVHLSQLHAREHSQIPTASVCQLGLENLEVN